MERTRRRKRNRKRAKFTVAINYRVVIVQNTLFVIWKIAKLILLVVSQLFSGLCFTHSLSIPVPHTHTEMQNLSPSLSLLLIAKCKSLFVFNFRYNSLIANCFTNNLHFLSLHFIPYFSLLCSLDSFILSFFNSFSLSLSFLKPTRINVHLNFCLSLSVKMRERKGEREEN